MRKKKLKQPTKKLHRKDLKWEQNMVQPPLSERVYKGVREISEHCGRKLAQQHIVHEVNIVAIITQLLFV